MPHIYGTLSQSNLASVLDTVKSKKDKKGIKKCLNYFEELADDI